jgi:hypothetical protein
MPDVRGGGTVKVGQVTLTAAQVQALVTTPIQVVAAPGAGWIVSILSATAYIDYNSVAYTTGADIILEYGTADVVVFDGILALTADTVMVASQAGSVAVASAPNTAVNVTADDVPGAGNSPVTVSVVYTLIPL